MTLPELCIRRPVMTTLLMMAFVVFGVFSYRLLPVAAIPRVDFPTIVVSANLPGAASQMTTPPSFQKINPADQPVIYLSLNSDTLPLYQVDEYAETMIAEQIATLPGVGQVQVFGAQKFAVRIQ